VAKLDARGLTLGVVDVVGLTDSLAVAVVKATALAQAGFVVPGSVLQLSQEAIGTSMKSVSRTAKFSTNELQSASTTDTLRKF